MFDDAQIPNDTKWFVRCPSVRPVLVFPVIFRASCFWRILQLHAVFEDALGNDFTRLEEVVTAVEVFEAGGVDADTLVSRLREMCGDRCPALARELNYLLDDRSIAERLSQSVVSLLRLVCVETCRHISTCGRLRTVLPVPVTEVSLMMTRVLLPFRSENTPLKVDVCL